MERRTEPKVNSESQSTRRTQDWENVSQAADRIRQYVAREPRERLTTLLHHVTPEALRCAFFAQKENAAAGADGMTWGMYAEGLDDRLVDLHDRVHSGAYRATPSRRVNIPKPDGGTRPLGVAAIEDKIVRCCAQHMTMSSMEEFPPRISWAPDPFGILDATVCLQAFVLNVRGCIDNLSHIWVREKGLMGEDDAPPDGSRVGFGPGTEAVVESLSPELAGYLKELGPWFVYLGRFRRALEHHVPLYLPGHAVPDEISRVYG